METVGIIAEYNPFHNGHLHHIKETKKLFPNAIVVLILNGYFLQRGELSLLSKEEKTRISLEYGVNLVIELPFVFGTQAADIFAYNSIKLLNELSVDKIVFGSEGNNPALLKEIADYQLNNLQHQEDVKQFMDAGMNYPTAMAKASKGNISTPNDLLGISYIKAILQINSKMGYFTIQRTNDYHDNLSNDKIVSASNVREKIKNNIDIKKYIPKYSFEFDTKINIDYFDLLKYKIITEPKLNKYLTVDEGIENRLKKFIYRANSLEELIKLIKTKRYTHNRINRMFIHILIGLTKEDINTIQLDYINILGFDEEGKKYLNKIKKNLNLPILNNKLTSKVLNYERIASAIYDLITNKNTMEFETKNKPRKKAMKTF